jgi:alpha-amylase
LRVTKDDRLLVIHNLSGESQQAVLSSSNHYGDFNRIVLHSSEAAELKANSLNLPPYSTVVIR